MNENCTPNCETPKIISSNLDDICISIDELHKRIVELNAIMDRVCNPTPTKTSELTQKSQPKNIEERLINMKVDFRTEIANFNYVLDRMYKAF